MTCLVVDFDLERWPAAYEAADLGARDVGGDALRQVPIARAVASSPAVLDIHLHWHVAEELPESKETIPKEVKVKNSILNANGLNEL